MAEAPKKGPIPKAESKPEKERSPRVRPTDAKLKANFKLARGKLVKFGLADAQIEWIGRVLPSIADRLAPVVPAADVGDVLMKIGDATKALNLIVRSVGNSPAHAEAVSHFNTAVQCIDAVDPGDGTWPEVVDFVQIARLLDGLHKAAVAAHGPFKQRGGYRDPGGAVERLLWAMNRVDPKALNTRAREVTENIKPVAEQGKSKKNRFVDIARVVFGVATGEDWYETNRSLKGLVDPWRQRQVNPLPIVELGLIVPESDAGIQTP